MRQQSGNYFIDFLKRQHWPHTHEMCYKCKNMKKHSIRLTKKVCSVQVKLEFCHTYKYHKHLLEIFPGGLTTFEGNRRSHFRVFAHKVENLRFIILCVM